MSGSGLWSGNPGFWGTGDDEPPTPAAPTVVTRPSISGTPRVGVSLVLSNGSATGSPSPIPSERTIRNADDDSLIDTLGPSESTWTPTESEVGLSVYLRVVWSNTEGSAIGESDPTAPIESSSVAPTVTVAPALEGTAQVGGPLLFDNGTASGSPTPSITSRTIRNAADNGLIATLNPGDTTWTPDIPQDGLTVYPRVVWQNSAGSVNGNGSNVGPIAPSPTAPIITGSPSLSGTAQVGVALTLNNGTAVGIPTPTIQSRTIRNAADDTVIATLAPGDTTWTPGAGEQGDSVYLRVVWENSAGTATGNSIAVGPIAAAGTGPTNLVAPSVVGIPQVGQQVQWDVGIWDTATSIDLEVVITGGARDGEVVLARQNVQGDSTGSIIPDLTGESIILKSWGINGGGETLAQSAAFGPFVSGFIGRGVLFNGTNNSLTLTGRNDAIGSQQLTLSFWLRHTATAGGWNSNPSARVLEAVHAATGTALSIRTASAGRLSFIVGNTANANAARTLQAASSLVVDRWYHIAVSVDRATERFQIYIDRAPVAATAYTWGDLVINGNLTALGIGATTGNAARWPGDLAHVWIDYGTSLDFSDPTNLDRFVTSNGLPVDLGTAGELATGTEPNFYFDGTAATWNNRVTGGPAFTVNGDALTASVPPPQF